MGRPFENELKNLAETYSWSLNAPIDQLINAIYDAVNFSVLTVGSGGSLTAAYFAQTLHEQLGLLCKAVTPYSLMATQNMPTDTAVFFFTAGGGNSDILSAFKATAAAEPRSLVALCMRKESPLSKLARNYSYTKVIEYELPCGKDGFLATNSLLAQMVLLVRAYREILGLDIAFPEATWLSDYLFNVEENIQPIIDKETLVILYGYWGAAPAIDLESKLTEAALRHVQIADYRNFAHGRHHWLAKNALYSGVISLATPQDFNINEKTLKLIPNEISKCVINSETEGPWGTIELLVKVFYLINRIGRVRGIDPGRPGVPQFGRSIYNMKYRIPGNPGRLEVKLKEAEARAIKRKISNLSLNSLNKDQVIRWKNAYNRFVKELQEIEFGAVVFDYDGTLCEPERRFSGLSEEIANSLNRLLEENIIVGVASGRGKSVKEALRRVIPKKYWDKVIIGFYNGADIGTLEADEVPVKSLCELEPGLYKVESVLKQDFDFLQIAQIESRPKQISIIPLIHREWRRARQIIYETIAKCNIPGVRALESGHSLDIICEGVSKLNILKVCSKVSKESGNPQEVLCIGDKGAWPGNDYELLGTKYSLSVDSVSKDPYSCWNLTKQGTKGAQATLFYFSLMDITEGRVKIKF